MIESAPKPNNARKVIARKVLRRTVGSVRNAYLVAEQKDAFDIFGNYIATKMRGLNSSVDIEKIKILKTPLLQYSVLLFKKYTIFILS